MNEHVRNILREMDSYEQTPEAFDLELRMSLSELIMHHLHENNWTQSKLAERAGLKEEYLTRVIHGAQNVTSKTAGRLLWALGVRGRITEHFSVDAIIGNIAITDITHAEEKNLSQGETGGQFEVWELTGGTGGGELRRAAG